MNEMSIYEEAMMKIQEIEIAIDNVSQRLSAVSDLVCRLGFLADYAEKMLGDLPGARLPED